MASSPSPPVSAMSGITSLINIPANMIIGNTISASDISYVYSALSSGTQNIVLSECYTNSHFVSNALSGLTFGSCKLTATDDNVLFAGHSDLNDVMSYYGLSANASLEGTICYAQWREGQISFSILTACMKSGSGPSDYTWVSNPLLQINYDNGGR